VAWLLAHYSPGDVVYRLFLLACTIFEPAFSIFEGAFENVALINGLSRFLLHRSDVVLPLLAL
jgi:hypothetical protein